jgi:DNA-binding SARP family transcriptional activator
VVAATLDVRVLGPIEVLRGGTRLTLAGSRQRAVLARLIVARGAVVPADRIIEDVWAGDPPPHALGVVQAHISTLRRLLEPDRAPRAPAELLVTRPPGYALQADSDADAFTRLVTRGIELSTGDDPSAAGHLLDQALGLWRGVPYADLSDEAWLAPEIARLRELHLAAREQRLFPLVADHRVHAAIAELEVLVGEHPLREGLWRLLALALYRTGRQADALAALRHAREVLAEELGLDPSPALRELEAAVLTQSPDLLAAPGTTATPGAPTARGASMPGAARSVPSGDRPLGGPGPSPLVVGREDTLTVLARAAAAAESGNPGLVLLTGEPGIGKTWLAQAQAAACRGAGWTVVWGRCHEASGAPALWPWLQVLTELADRSAPPPPLQRLLDAGGPGLPEPGAEAADARFQQHHAMARYLAGVANAAPLLVVLDDLQWADAATVGMLAAVPGLAGNGRLLILGTARSGAANGNAPAVGGTGTRVALTGLDLQSVAAVARASGVDADPAMLARRTGGNPFLLRETLRAMSAAGAVAGAGVPATAADMLRQRLAALHPQAVSMLQTAAVAGRVVDVDLLRALTGLESDALLDLLDSAVLAGVLTEADRAGLGFVHDLIRETLYADLPPMRRARIHARVLAALQARPGTEVTALATHAVAAGAVVPAGDLVRLASAAAEQDFARLGYDDAVRWLRHALRAQEHLPVADARPRVELMLRLVTAQLAAGDAIGALETRNAAVRAADGHSDSGLRARALVALDAPSLWALRGYDAVDLDMVGRLHRALEEPDLAPDLRCRLLATLANELSYSPDSDTRQRVAAQAVAAARPLGDPGLLGFALNAAFLACDADPLAWRRDAGPIAQELFDLDHRHRLPGLALLGHLILAPASVTGYQISVADAHAAQTEALLRRLPAPLPALQHRCWVFNRHLLDGRFDAAEAILDDVAAAALPWWRFDPLLAATRLGLLWQTGRIAEAAPLLPAVRSVHPAIAGDAEVLMLVAQSSPDEATDLVRRSPRAAISRDWMWSFAACLRAAAVAACGDDQARATAYADLAPYRGLIATTGTTDAGPVDYYLALLTHARGDEDSTAQHLNLLETRSRNAGLDCWADRAGRMLDHQPTAPHLWATLESRH